MKQIPSIILFVFLVSSFEPAWNQMPIGKYNYLGDRYLHLENDSLVSYMLPFGTRGAMKITQAGIGLYKTFCDTIIIWTVDSLSIRNLESNTTFEWDTTDLNYNRPKKIFKFEFITNNDVIITGPIIENYEKLNRKKFRRGFRRWPWKWSFKREHWYDPGVIELIKE